MPTVYVVFDGGVRHGNPGPGYGSYAVWGEGRAPSVRRKNFGRVMTNNEAEYEALIAAFQYVLRVCQLTGREPGAFTLHVKGDSQVVIRQYTGEYGVNEPKLVPYLQRARDLGARFGAVIMEWHRREESVKLLGP